MAANGTDCVEADIGLRSVDPSNALRVGSLAFWILSMILIFGSLLAWYHRRKNPFLLRRGFGLVFLSGIGVVCNITAGSLDRAAAGMPCFVFVLLLYASFVLTFWPVSLRLVQFYRQIKYDETLVELVSGQDGMELDWKAASNDSRLRFKRFQAGWIWNGTLLILPLLLNFIAAISFSQVVCSCETGAEGFDAGFPIFLCTLIFIMAGVILFSARDKPDPLGLFKETTRAYGVAILLQPASIALIINDPFGLTQQADSPWNWALLLELSFLIFFLMVCLIPVISSTRPTGSFDEDEELASILSSDLGKKCFAKYLATELSIENLLFYDDANNWLQKYDEQESQERRDAADQMYEKYLAADAEFQINISSAQFSRVRALFESGNELPKETFVESATEVYKLMSTDSFRRFKKSKLYALYYGSLTPGGELAQIGL